MTISTLDNSTARDAVAHRIGERFPALGAGGGALPDKLAAAGIHRRVPAGSVMFDQGTPCGGFPLVLEGTVRVVQRYPNGRELLLYRIAAGEFCLLSGSCLLSDASFVATGIAETDLELVILPASAFARLLAEEETFRRQVFASFGERLAALMQVVEAIAYHKLDRRLAALLLSRSDAEGVVHASHQELADSLGSVREIITRLLRSFEDHDWVDLGRQRIRIVDAAALRAMTQA